MTIRLAKILIILLKKYLKCLKVLHHILIFKINNKILHFNNNNNNINNNNIINNNKIIKIFRINSNINQIIKIFYKIHNNINNNKIIKIFINLIINNFNKINQIFKIFINDY